MPFSHLPPLLTRAFLDLGHWLHKRSAARLPLLLCGILFARGRRTGAPPRQGPGSSSRLPGFDRSRTGPGSPSRSMPC